MDANLRDTAAKNVVEYIFIHHQDCSTVYTTKLNKICNLTNKVENWSCIHIRNRINSKI